MENSEQLISSSTTCNPSLSSKSDENGQNYPPFVANLNRRKPGETEKLVKKKTLTERNQAIDPKFTENSLLEIPNVDPKPSSCKVDSVFQTTLPYDPLTNYLSPRPRFLRYKPNKRREIFLRTVGEDSVSVSNTSSSEEEETKMKDEEESEGKSNEIDDENAEDKEEDSRWTVKELLKFLLVVASLISSTLYISSMNTSSHSFEVSGVFRSGSFPNLNHTREFGLSPVVESIYANGNNFWDEELAEAESIRNSEGLSQLSNREDAKDRGFMEETELLNCENEGGKAVFGDVERVEYTDLVEEAREKPLAEAESIRNSEGLSQLSNQENVKDRGFMEETEILNCENEGGKAVFGDVERVEYTALVEEAREKLLAEGSITEEMAEGEKNGGQFSELNFEDNGDRKKRKEPEISNTTSVPCETLEEDEIAGASNINGFVEDKLLSCILTAAENECNPQVEVVEKEEGGDLEMIESHTGEHESFEFEADKISMVERITKSLSSFVEDLENMKSELVELMHTETEPMLKVVLGLLVSSAMLTCFVMSFQLKKKKDDTKVPAIFVSVEPLVQGPVEKAEKKVTTRASPSIKAICDVSGSNNEPINNVDSFKTLSPSIHLRDEGEIFKKIYHNEAPTVQFLGEFVVGEISNSVKNKRGNIWTIEVEDSNFPCSVEEKPVSKNVNSGPEQALSEFSATTSSPFYESFTTKKKIVKKEVGGDGEVKSIPTPLRRSTRIRNRMISP